MESKEILLVCQAILAQPVESCGQAPSEEDGVNRRTPLARVGNDVPDMQEYRFHEVKPARKNSEPLENADAHLIHGPCHNDDDSEQCLPH